MSDDADIWVRIPKHLFEDTRRVLTDAADDLATALRRSPTDPCYPQSIARLRLINAELDRTGRGLLITNDKDAA